MLHGAAERNARDALEFLSVTTVPAERPGRVIVKVVGEVDRQSASLLGGRLQAELARGDITELIVDMQGVSFLGVGGLSVLITARAHAQRGGINFSVRCDGARAVLRTLQLTGLSELLCIDPPAEENCRGGVVSLATRRRRRPPWA